MTYFLKSHRSSAMIAVGTTKCENCGQSLRTHIDLGYDRDGRLYECPKVRSNHIFGRRVTNQDIANAAFGIEQGLRAIERYKIPTCVEHGGTWCRGKGLYHANGKTHHHVFKTPCVNNCRKVR